MFQQLGDKMRVYSAQPKYSSQASSAWADWILLGTINASEHKLYSKAQPTLLLRSSISINSRIAFQTEEIFKNMGDSTGVQYLNCYRRRYDKISQALK